jgi:RNA polymerase-binding transcription factor DksA
VTKKEVAVDQEQLAGFKKIREAEQAGAGWALLQNRHNIVIENSADVLEEIWRTADRELPMANLGWRSSLLRNIRATLVRIKDDAFGACLCCRTVIGLRRLRAAPWTPLCIRCQEAADRNDAEVLRSRSRGWRRRRRISHGNATKSISKERNVNRV